MQIIFLMHNIKNKDMIYEYKSIFDEMLGCECITETYKGGHYCETVLNQVETISNFTKGECEEHIGCEIFRIGTENNSYSVIFTFCTRLESQQCDLQVEICPDDAHEAYDGYLEKLKIAIKDALLKEWVSCTWIFDEQSEFLCAKLYPSVMKIENQLRAFVNRVLISSYGVDWYMKKGCEHIFDSHEKNSVSFKRTVKEFANINDVLISLSLETLISIILKTNFYKTHIPLLDADYEFFHRLIRDAHKTNTEQKQGAKLLSRIKGKREIEIELWCNVFEHCFENPDEFKKLSTALIKNRNHIAHNKLLTASAAGKMEQDFDAIEEMIKSAMQKFQDDNPSQEYVQELLAQQESEEFEYEYTRMRIYEETGIEVRSESQILQVFSEFVEDMYTFLSDSEYFNYSVDLSPLSELQNTETKQLLFIIKSNVNARYNLCFSAQAFIDDDMSGDSSLEISVNNANEETLFSFVLNYHNGSAHEDYIECTFIPDEESSVTNREEYDVFIKEIVAYAKCPH